jgi:hypothetical protein
MQYLDLRRTEIDPSSFRERRPFPWINIQGLLTDDGFRHLCDALPDVNAFTKEFGSERYALQYTPRLELQQPWHDFIAELQDHEYRYFLRRLFGLRASQRIELTMHWHFAASGFCLMPHVDARRKMGSHIFYFNSEADWDSSWGGHTLVLDDRGTAPANPKPDFRDFQQVAASEILGNQSFIFQRTQHSWHGVHPLKCPPGKLRKVFIVVVNRVNLQVLWRHLRGKDADGYALQ